MTETTVSDPRRTLLDAPLSRFQWAAISITVLLCALDGFDVLAITYAAPGFLQEWGLSHAELGFALAMGLVGMAIGSFLIAPFADVIGRRYMILGCLVVMALGMGASAACHSLAQLSFWRVFTGLGIGAMICTIIPLAAEYSNARHRDFTIALMAVGYPIGGTLGGLAAAQLLELYDWRAVFSFGALVAVVMIPLALGWMPEPVAYLIDKPDAGALAKVNRFLARCGHPAVSTLPPPTPRTGAVPMLEVFSPGNRASTIHVTLIYCLYVTAVYFFLTWTPKLVADLGFSPAVSATVAVTRDMSGVLGGLLLGWSAHYLGLKRLVLLAMTGLGVALIVFGRLAADIAMLRVAAAIAGFFLYGGMVGLYAILSRAFATHVPATGSGFVVGVGRVTSAIAPLLGGYLFTLGWNRVDVTFTMAMFALIAATLLLLFRVRPIGVD